MSGLGKILKLTGSIICKGNDGEKVVWLWDYVNDKARLKSEMTDEEIKASEKAKWMDIKQ